MRHVAMLCALLQWGALVWPVAQVLRFEQQRQVIRKEIKLRLKAGVPDNERVLFQFAAHEVRGLDWVKPDKEFRWKGRFYDVVERRTSIDGQVTLECIDDHQETVLFAGLQDTVDRAMDQRGMDRSDLLRLFRPCAQQLTEPLNWSPPATTALVVPRGIVCGGALTGVPMPVDRPPRRA